jgi:PrmC N-terminal domain
MHLALLSARLLLELFGGVIVVALISLEGWIILQLLPQQGRLLLRLEAAEAQVAAGRTAVQLDGTTGSTLAQRADAIRALVDQAEGMPALRVLPVAALANSNGPEASSSPNSHVDPAVGARTTTVGDAVERGTYALMRKGQLNARLNTQLLLAHVLGVKWQTLDAQCELSLAQEQEFLRLLERCGDDEPLDYLVPEPVDILIANLPYLGTNEFDMVVPVVRENEPHLALFGGPNGLELLQRFFVEAQQLRMLRDKAVVLLEIDFRHREMLTAQLHEIWPQAIVSFGKDCFGVDRVLQVYL